jgi:molybdenum-dependent DNA-binding transcriptional regulator ModE
MNNSTFRDRIVDDETLRITPDAGSDGCGAGLTRESAKLLAMFDSIEQAVNSDRRIAKWTGRCRRCK